MSQKENFTLGTHYFLKGVAKAGISFPSTKADCVIRARVETAVLRGKGE